MVATPPPRSDPRLERAIVLVAARDLDGAEKEIERALAERPDEGEALSLLAKIKHIRGELSEAFACWARARADAPLADAARMRLMSILQLARDPERGAGEFLALGQDQLWRKPAPFLELEKVFQLFVKRQPDEARLACERLAQRMRTSDPELYKLAVLAEALIAELAGNFEEARVVLERLGRERGYESDIDRALALARVYELLGKEEHLEQAAKVCEYLASTLTHFEAVANLGRLAHLYRALGRAGPARQCEARFIEAFRRRMYRPTLAQLTAVAAQRYVPLAHLAAVPLPDGKEVENGWQGRRRALALALLDRRQEAGEILERGGEVLDRKVLADLALAGGDETAAIELYLGTLRDDPDDLEVVGWLLEHLESEAAEPAREYFRQPDNARRVRAALGAMVHERPLRARWWQRSSAFARLLGETEAAARYAARAAALAAAAGRRERAVGRVLAAAVYHFAGQAIGLIHEVWAERRPAPPGRGGRLEEVLGNLTPQMVDGVRNTFVSVREYARAKLPHLAESVFDYDYAFKITKEDEPSGGLSAGLPTALAFLSVFIDRPVPQDVAASGVLVTDAHDVLVVRAVSEAEFKVRGAYNRDLRMVLLPAANRAELADSPLVPREICTEVVRFVSNLDEAVAAVFGEEVWLA